MVDKQTGLPVVYHIADPAQRGSQVDALPPCVFIEVTNRCNLHCAACPHTLLQSEPLATLTLPQFRAIVDQFPTIERAVLHGIGEPLLNPDLSQMVHILKELGAIVLFNTNATLLTPEWAAALIESGLDELRCSVDGVSPETYARVRGAPLLPRVIENLRQMTTLQRRLGVEWPRISLWITAMRENLAEIPDLVRLAADVGVPEVYVHRLVYFLDGDGRETGLMDPLQAVFGAYDQREDAVLTEAEALADELGVTLGASGGTDPRNSLASANRQKRPWSACSRPWTTAYITANGNALPCCISPFATTDYQSLIMGNVFERSFLVIWNDAPYRGWREALLGDNPRKTCSGCGVRWSL